jgi:A/G-specific adenine glycosylase
VEKSDEKQLDPEGVEQVRTKLLSWYDKNRRDLPWRRERDPYKIWVSEVMLQQTRVDTVIPYYERFMQRFPTLQDLASAPEEEVIKAWEGLGYYSRVRNLHAAVREVAKSHGGKVPDDREAMSRLKGVGPYTVGAVLSIAYNQRLPAVDGNVMRVFSRLYAIEEDITKAATRRRMEALAMDLIPEDRPGDFNQALMELGALICSPSSPACDRCPLVRECRAYEQGRVKDFPVKRKGKAPLPVSVVFGWVVDGEGRMLLERRPGKGLLAGMWGLPTVERGNDDSPRRILERYFAEKGFPIEPGPVLGHVEHVFSHRRWQGVVVSGRASDSTRSLPPGWRWVAEEELDFLALPKVYEKALSAVKDPVQLELGLEVEN